MPAGQYDRNGPWTPEREALLRRMWGAGCSASAIARELKCEITRNAVVGKAARLGLERRSSPIKKDKPLINPTPRQKANARRFSERNHSNMGEAGAKSLRLWHSKKKAGLLPEPPKPKPLPMPRLDSRSECRWPIGDPKARDFRFCNAKPVVQGKPYCEAHCAIAYQQMPDKLMGRGAA